MGTRAESLQAEERSFRIYMGRQHEIRRLRHRGRPRRLRQRTRRIHRTCPLPGTRHVQRHRPDRRPGLGQGETPVRANHRQIRRAGRHRRPGTEGSHQPRNQRTERRRRQAERLQRVLRPHGKHRRQKPQRRHQLRPDLLPQLLPCLPDKQVAGNLLPTIHQPRLPHLPVRTRERVRRIQHVPGRPRQPATQLPLLQSL